MARGQADPELVRQVAVQARAAGMDPIDLLTVIGYETGGTYNPAQRGPTTKWGTHRGIIQFGEPQAKKYGVDFNGPVGNQVAAAIKFIQDHGWKPGMGRLGMYAAINAGDASKIHASDAKAGGAWGTVADKVNYQMGAHEARAKNLLSQYDTGATLPAQTQTGVAPSEIPWGGYGYKPPELPKDGLQRPPGVLAPEPTTTGSTGQPGGGGNWFDRLASAPTAPYSAAPNSDAARMLSDPSRYGLSPEQAVEMRRQMQAGGPGGGTIGNIPAAPPSPVPTSASAPPPGALSSSGLPPSPHREPTPEEREATKQYLAGMGPGPIGIWNPDKIWWQQPWAPKAPPEDPIETLKRLDPEGKTMMAQQPAMQPGQGGQGSAGQLFDDWRNKRPLGLFQGGWT